MWHGGAGWVVRMPDIRRIGVLTGGGDAPGLNAVIRAVVRSSVTLGWECVGIEDSFDGLVRPNHHRVLINEDTRGILRLGGTILGTSNGGHATGMSEAEFTTRCCDRARELELDALVVIGGDGTLSFAEGLFRRGIPVVGVPKTIDNDIVGTTNCFGFDTAVAFATEAIDRLHTTAQAHHRIMVLEVMGRHAGWIALYAGMAGGADVILIPEIPFDLDLVTEPLRAREAKSARFSIVVVAEGARPRGGSTSVLAPATAGKLERLGGIGHVVAQELGRLTGKETRDVLLGHLQRGGTPTSFDRTLATRFGGKAVDLVRCGQFGRMVAFHPPHVESIPLDAMVGKTKTIPLDFDLIRTARAIGVSLGDAHGSLATPC